MIAYIDKGGYLEIYSDSGKKIKEMPDGFLWDTTPENPIAVDRTRFSNGDYTETDIKIDSTEELVEEENG